MSKEIHMSTKHTPGPWHIIHEPTLNTYHIRVEDLDAAPVASLFYSSGGCRPQFSRELIDANARLIAAAPDMALVLAGVACGAIRAEPGTRELAFDGLRYSLGRNPDWKRVVGIMGRDRLAAAIRKAGGGA